MDMYIDADTMITEQNYGFSHLGAEEKEIQIPRYLKR